MNKDVLEWDETFAAVAELASFRSKVIGRREGSCIVTGANHIVSIGYNGLPKGLDYEKYDQKTIARLSMSSAANALSITSQSLAGTGIFTTHYPDTETIKMVCQMEIKCIHHAREREDSIDYTAVDRIYDAKKYHNNYNKSPIFINKTPDVKLQIPSDKIISFEEYIICYSKIMSMRSKDPDTQVGAVIVNDAKQIISSGYNGMISGCSDEEFPWNKTGENHYDTKYPYVIPAEANAIFQAQKRSVDLRGTSIYTMFFPYRNCASAIVQAGIKHVYYTSDKYNDTLDSKDAKIIFDCAGVEYKKVPDYNIEVKTPTKVLRR